MMTCGNSILNTLDQINQLWNNIKPLKQSIQASQKSHKPKHKPNSYQTQIPMRKFHQHFIKVLRLISYNLVIKKSTNASS